MEMLWKCISGGYVVTRPVSLFTLNDFLLLHCLNAGPELAHMSDALQGSTRNISTLVDELIAQRPVSEPFKRSEYAGMK